MGEWVSDGPLISQNGVKSRKGSQGFLTGLVRRDYTCPTEERTASGGTKMLIAVISDTHMPDKARALPEALVERLRTVDLILHAGDFTSSATLRYISTLGPMEAVYGNVDDLAVRSVLPQSRLVEVGGFRIGLIHGDGPGASTLSRARKAFQDVDCIVFGHSHAPFCDIYDSVLMVNPGSPTDKRREPCPSYALLTVTDKLDAEIAYL
jgi:uncharacterized protein